MTLNGWLQIALFFGLLLLTVKPLGRYMTDVFEGKRTFLSFVLRPIERATYWICGVRENEEQTGSDTASACCCSASRGSSRSMR